MEKSGFCAYGPGPSHEFCISETCKCECHQEKKNEN